MLEKVSQGQEIVRPSADNRERVEVVTNHVLQHAPEHRRGRQHLLRRILSDLLQCLDQECARAARGVEKPRLGVALEVAA